MKYISLALVTLGTYIMVSNGLLFAGVLMAVVGGYMFGKIDN